MVEAETVEGKRAILLQTADGATCRVAVHNAFEEAFPFLTKGVTTQVRLARTTTTRSRSMLKITED